MWLIDSHIHLDYEQFSEDFDAVLERAYAADVREMITIGCRPESCKKAIRLAETYPSIYATVGVHPHQAAETNDEEMDWLREQLQHPRVVGLGECGLDYFYMNSPKEVQQSVFRKHAELSLETDMPLIIHTRDAEEDTIDILQGVAQGRMYRGLIHCFSGSSALVEACLEMGFYFSISGLVTFVKSLHKPIKTIPLDRLLIETDAPYLAPSPHRGERNEPAFVRHTAEKLAKVKGVSLEELAEYTTRNTRTVFRLPEPSTES